MKTDKEYPATHSMSTAWYIVDDEGNVGIMDYNENGPVPWGIEETNAMDLVLSDVEHDIDNKEVMFKLTDEQVFEILASSQKSEGKRYWYDLLVKIDLQKRKRFEELCRRHDIRNNNTSCISDTLGIYRIDPIECFDNNGLRIKGSSLDIMFEEEIILEVYQINEYDMDDHYDEENDKVYHTKSFDNAPYFIYHQPYWPDTCQERMNIPQNPVNISQCNEDVRHRIHKVKGLFREMKHIQIAQFVPCDATSVACLRIGSCEYALFPLPDGSRIYSLVYMTNYDFLPYCLMRAENDCTSCGYRCKIPENFSFTHEPTVLIVLDPKERPCYEWKHSKDVIFKRATCLPYVGCSPTKQGEHSPSSRILELTNLLSGTKGYFESIVNDLNPRVIILTEMANTVMGNVFTIDKHRVIINNKEYPIFRYEELEEYHDEIKRLALLPYQGKGHRLTYTETEMEELVKQGIAIKTS